MASLADAVPGEDPVEQVGPHAPPRDLVEGVERLADVGREQRFVGLPVLEDRRRRGQR